MEQSPSWEANRFSVKKFPAWYGIWRFINACTSARQLPLSRASSTQSMPSHPTSLKSFLVSSSHLRPGLPSGSFPQVSSPKPCIHLSSPSHTCYMSRPSHSQFYHPTNIGWGVQIIKLLIMYLFYSPLHVYFPKTASSASTASISLSV